MSTLAAYFQDRRLNQLDADGIEWCQDALMMSSKRSGGSWNLGYSYTGRAGQCVMTVN